MIRKAWTISDDYKDSKIRKLLENLPSLRARIGITQEEFANVIGTSRQTYYSVETGKREMSWTSYLAIIYFYDSIPETSEMVRQLHLFPEDFIKNLHEETV